MAGFQYTDADVASFSESGAQSLGLARAQQNNSRIKTTPGARIACPLKTNSLLTLISEIRKLWIHECLNGRSTMDASLNGSSGPNFTYDPAPEGDTSAFAGAGVTAQFNESRNASAYWNADFDNPSTTPNMVLTKLNSAVVAALSALD